MSVCKHLVVKLVVSLALLYPKIELVPPTLAKEWENII
jgi:hypothetical protein